MIRLFFICILLSSLSLPSMAQGRWTIGLDMARRIEIRQYQDSYKYLFTGGVPVLSIGGSIAFQYNDKWRFESGLFNTPYSNTVAVY